jgi:hypothetical protein
MAVTKEQTSIGKGLCKNKKETGQSFQIFIPLGVSSYFYLFTLNSVAK